jgi:acyl-CoA synthetase (AMP-forming)/AMP-acid ligase II
MVKIAGRRLDPAEVERALRQLPGVDEAFVELHRERADTLAAAVATRLTAAEIRALLQDRIAGWKIPKKLLPLPEFPLTARGKTDTARLRVVLQGG